MNHPAETGSPDHQAPQQHLNPASSANLTHPEFNNAPKVAPPSGPLTPAQARRLSQWGTLHRSLIQRCWAGKASPRQAIKAQCNECVGEDRQAVVECADRCCPLWRYRPYQESDRAFVNDKFRVELNQEGG
jgi:hypothetical protein